MWFADRFQLWNRQRKSDWIERFISERGIRTVLVVGIAGTPRNAWEGMIEMRIHQAAEWVVWSGLQCETWPMRPITIANGLCLPFPDRTFDLVFSNAVIEHVGDEADQQRFVAEQQRVATWWVATTPNRWFPIESHTRAVLRHWSPTWRRSQPKFTRLLSRSEFSDLCENVEGSVVSPTFTAWGGGQSST